MKAVRLFEGESTGTKGVGAGNDEDDDDDEDDDAIVNADVLEYGLSPHCDAAEREGFSFSSST